MSPKPLLAYWDIRGFAEPIRNLLHYVGVDFEDKQYALTADGDKSVWLNEKFNLGLDFPNLPYYKDGDVKLTQTMAILRYLARKHKLEGSNDVEYAKIAMLEQVLQEHRLAFGRVAYDPVVFANEKDAFVKDVLPVATGQVSQFLATNKFAVGANISYVDFYLYENLIILKNLTPEVLAKFDNLQQYIARFEALPQLQSYLKSRKPQLINGVMAKWNAKY